MSGSGAARLAAIPAGESPANIRSPVHVVVISSGRAGDQTVGSLEVKALWGRETGSIRRRGASNLTGRNVSKPGSLERHARVKRIAGTLGVPSRSDLGEGHVGIEELDHNDVRTPRGHRGRHARQEWSAKARNRSRVA